MSKLLATGSVVLKHFQRGQQYYAQQLRPYVHYVPVRHDLKDLVDKISWLQANDEHARTIAYNARRFAFDTLSPLAVDCYWLKLLTQYSTLQGFIPTKGDTDVEVTSEEGVLQAELWRLPRSGKGPSARQRHRVTCPAALHNNIVYTLLRRDSTCLCCHSSNGSSQQNIVM